MAATVPLLPVMIVGVSCAPIILGLWLGSAQAPSSVAAMQVLLIGLVALMTLAFSWLSAILGLVSKSVEGVQWLTFVLVFPLTFASSAFVDASTMTSWLRGFAENQPITHIVNVVRELLVGIPAPNDAGMWAVIWLIAIIVVSIPVASWLFTRKTSQ